MKRLTLGPEQVLATNDSFPKEDLAFLIYYRVFARGGGDSLPPIIVQTIKSPSEWIARLEIKYAHWVTEEPNIVETRRKEYNIVFKRLREIPYYILDGNYRALAAALNRQTVSALQVESDRDLVEIERMISTGYLLSFPHAGLSVDELEGLSLKYFLNLNDVPPNHGLNVSHKVDIARLVSTATRAYDLCTSKKIAAHMVKNYSARKNIRSTVPPSQPFLSR